MCQAYAETFLDVEKLIWSIVHQFKREYGGDLEELFGESQIIFCELYTGNGRPYIKEKKGKSFTASLSYYIRCNLLSLRRKQLMRDARCEVKCKDPEDLGMRGKEQSTGLVDILDSVSADARAIVNLILNTPGYIWRLECPAPDFSDEDTARGMLGFVQQYLRALDWSDRKINRCFNEIREALS